MSPVSLVVSSANETMCDCGQSLSSVAKCNTPADLISARLFKTLRSVAMRSYSHLSEDERDQIGVLRAAGRSMGAIARALGRAKTTISRELQRNALPPADIRRFTPPEPINCAGGVKRSSTERPLCVCSWVIGSPRDGRPNRSPVGCAAQRQIAPPTHAARARLAKPPQPRAPEGSIEESFPI